MPSHDDVVATGAEDEVLALTHQPDRENNTETGNEPIIWTDIPVDVVEPMDEDSPEEEPSEYEEENEEEEVVGESEPEEEAEDEDPEEAPFTPTASPTPPPPPPTYQIYPGGPSHTYAPHQDPYFPPSPTALPSPPRWAWIRRVLGIWRHEEGERVPEVSHTPVTAPVCPVTEEPTHLTIPLIVARLHRHENQLHDFIESHRNQLSPDLALQMHNELRLLRSDHRELCDAVVTLENTAIRRIINLEGDVRRLRGLNDEVRDLRRMMVEMTLRDRDRAGPSFRDGDHE